MNYAAFMFDAMLRVWWLWVIIGFVVYKTGLIAWAILSRRSRK